MMLARFRTLEEYGTYSSLLLVINLFISLLMLGLPNSINYFLARAESDSEKRRFLSVYYTAGTVLSFLIGVLLVLCVPLIQLYFENNAIGKFWYFLALYPWASIISNSIENILVVYQRVRLLMVCKLVSSAAMLLSVLLVQLFGYGFKAYMIIFMIVNAVYALSAYLLTQHLCGRLRPIIDMQLIKTILTFSLPIGLATMVGTLSIEIDKLLIGLLMDTKQLAIYTNAAKELPLTIVSASITAVLLPRAAVLIKKDRVGDAVKLWKVSTELSFIIIALFTAGVVTYAKDVLTLLYSEKYLPGVNVFRIYTVILLLRCAYFGLILNAIGQTKKILLCSVYNLVLNALLNPLFYYIFGIVGPALATFVSVLILQIHQLKYTASETKISFSNVFPWKSVGIILLINAAFSAAFYFIKQLLPLQRFMGELAESLLLGAVWAALYLLIMKKRIVSDWHELNSFDAQDETVPQSENAP